MPPPFRSVFSLARASNLSLTSHNLRKPAILYRTFSLTSKMATEYKLKDLASIPSLSPGDKKAYEVEGIDGGKVLLLNAAGTIQATGSKCTHYGAPLASGILTKDGRLTCPWHGACFNAKTGDVEDAPALDAIPIFKVTERDGGVYITGEEAAIKGSRRTPKFACSSVKETPDKKVVVVGGGAGAVGVVDGLREKGFDGAITIISNEGYLPIDRPKLSKALMADPEKINLRNKEWYDSGKVKWVDGEVTAVDFQGKQVHTKGGDKIDYGKLVLATGGTPKALPLPGFKNLKNIFPLRNIHDVKKINEAIGDKGKKVVIVGSSFIGMEIAVALAKDNDVSVIGMEKVPLQRVLGEKVGAGLQKFVEGKGVKFHLDASVEKAEASGLLTYNVGSVSLKDGTKIEADLVVLGVGVSPATEYLKDNKAVKLEDDGSLTTNENFLVNGFKDVYAIGDIATYPYHGPGGQGAHTRIEHWNVAQNAGRSVATTISGATPLSSKFIPIFWSALGAQLRYCGNTPNGWDDAVVLGNPSEGKFAAYYTKGDSVVAMASMGWDPAMVKSAELMKLGQMPGKKDLEGGLDILSVDVTA